MTSRVHIAAGLALVLLGIGATPAAATTFVVNSTSDPATPDNVCSPAPGGCTLRDAVDDAGPADMVSVPGGAYQLTQGPLRPSGESIVGAGARSTIINGGGVGGVFVVITAGNRLSGVTLTNGGGQNQEGAGGGGILLTSSFAPASITVVNTTISGNAGLFGAGIANNGGTLTLIGSTVSGNIAFATSVGTAGGGLGLQGGTTRIINSTISGNIANSGETTAGGGGIYFNVSSNTTLSLTIENSTIANNRAETGAGLFMAGSTGTSVTVSHTIVADNLLVTGQTGSSCNRDLLSLIADHDIADDASCDFAGAPRDPQIGGLANNGGQTNTHALAITSPAINAGTSCPSTDQRGFARDGACDIGAFGYVRPRLTVIKRVVNDDKGIEAADDFTVHVRVGAADVAGSPAPGSAGGRTYTLTPGSYSVGEDASEVYAGSFAGDCSASGVVVLGEGQSKSCTITNDDKAPGLRVFNVEPKRGTVRIKLPGRKRFRRLTEGEQLPVGTTVDTRKGRVTIIAASNKKGGTSRADFYDGIFKLGQTRGRRPISTLTLVEKLTGCKAAGKQASAAAKKKRRRRLWGDGKGRFRTRGTHSAATVVGTKWLVEDRCTSTLTRVARGRVKVTDFEKHKSVFVRKGHRYIARAQ
jgi:Prealbumin-like fold domain